ncbi:hypothetical protein B5V90_03215 [Heyndrickxia sporothermodurans]|nr:hypothetical protein B5V90_03215 [Heyndrickxia sporothermodurans]
MALITLNPAPTIFDSATTVQTSQDTQVATVVFSTDGSAPTLAKNLAYDTLSPPNPFISVVQDGKGNCLFDGGFPKWYNTYYNSAWASFADLNNTYKYFYNALDFIANKSKSKKVLFIGDLPMNSDGSYPNYHVRSSTTNGFRTSIEGLCAIAGYQPTIIAPEDYTGNLIDLSYSYLDQFCSVVLFGSLHTSSQRTLSQGTINNLIAFREAGNGIFIITDHGEDDGSGGFFYNSNLLARELGAEFRGNYDRTPVNVGFLIDNYGEHDLWKNMTREDSISAGGSESRVVITEHPSYAKAPSFSINQDGWTTVRYLVQLKDGSLHLENFTYGLNVAEFVFFSGNPKTVLNNELINYDVQFPSGTDASEIRGIVRHNSDVRGEFVRTTSGLTKSWLSSNSQRIYPKEGDIIEVAVTEPFTYFKSIKVGRVQPPAGALSLPQLYKDVSIHELASLDQRGFLQDFNSKLGTKSYISAAQKIKSLRDYLNN